MEQGITYGSQVTSAQLCQTLEHTFMRNLQLQSEGKQGTPVCIWGTHGIGKTMIIQEFARSHHWQFAYCAPAQFEEMGDFHGLPHLVDPTHEKHGAQYTSFAPPEWVPKQEGPGILLLDDINRADDRILRGLMQLLQNSEMVSWALPRKWQIVATANPECGDYSVTPMDNAMLTRMLHLTLRFDVHSWANWALSSGVDPRGVEFVLTYPEMMTSGKRTTPRTLVQFFEQIQTIDPLKEHMELVRILAESALDEHITGCFLSFIQDDLEHLLMPEEILESPSFNDCEQRLNHLVQKKDGPLRLDRLGTVCSRLAMYLKQKDLRLNTLHASNLVQFFLMPFLPNDLRMSMYQELLQSDRDELKEILRDKKIAKVMLSALK
ncbi:MAG: AAA family ATPase [SAR324 cluster bacterium]|nr:AAA family ATPase [SAR324 cluster bacterium]